MRYFFCVIISFLIMTAFESKLYAQLNYKDGFVIKQNKDTLQGQVGVKKLDQTYNICYFKQAGSGKLSKYSPEEILAFGVNDGLFFISISMDGLNEKAVFGQVLVRGKASLLKNGETYFAYIDDKMIPLTGEYKKKLLELMKDCASAEYEVLLAKKEDASLSRLFENYNECIGFASQTYYWEPPKFIGQWTAGAGYSYSVLKTQVSTLQGNKSKVYTPQLSWLVGATYEFRFTKKSSKLSYEAGIYYQRFSYRQDFSTFIEKNYRIYVPTTIFQHAEISLSQVSVPLMVKYHIPKNLYNMYVGIGISWNKNIDFSFDDRFELLADQEVQTGGVENEYNPSNSQQAINLAVGIDKIFSQGVHLGLELKGTLGNSLFSTDNYFYTTKSSSNNLALLVYYKF